MELLNTTTREENDSFNTRNKVTLGKGIKLFEMNIASKLLWVLDSLQSIVYWWPYILLAFNFQILWDTTWPMSNLWNIKQEAPYLLQHSKAN